VSRVVELSHSLKEADWLHSWLSQKLRDFLVRLPSTIKVESMIELQKLERDATIHGSSPLTNSLDDLCITLLVDQSARHGESTDLMESLITLWM
jgi:hypothetical protein